MILGREQLVRAQNIFSLLFFVIFFDKLLFFVN